MLLPGIKKIEKHYRRCGKRDPDPNRNIEEKLLYLISERIKSRKSFNEVSNTKSSSIYNLNGRPSKLSIKKIISSHTGITFFFWWSFRNVK